MTLFPHQLKYAINDAPDRAFLAWETGLGKSLAAVAWIKNNRNGDPLIVCPKRVVEKWKKEASKLDVRATILSKEQFKKTPLKKWSAIVLDEADEFASPLFIAKSRSQLTEKAYELMRLNEDTPRLLLSATPVRSNPANLHTLLCLLGVFIPWKKWQDRFYQLERRPYLSGMAWLPKPTWRKDMRPLIEKYCDVKVLKDILTEPTETNTITKTPSAKFVPQEWEPAKSFYEEHKHEQRGKLPTIKTIAKGYRKVLVVAHYVEQCEHLQKELSKERETFLVYGKTKDQEEVLRHANEDVDECYLIVQASLGAGFDADSFSAVIFASQSYAVRDAVQMRGRVRRIHNLHHVDYHYLIGGRCDQAVYDTIQKGMDFIPSSWRK